MPSPDLAARLPDAAELDSLRPYLAPVPPLPVWLDETRYAASGDAARPTGPDPWRALPAPATLAEGEPGAPREYALSAVFQGPGRTVAVIDDRQVRTGDVMPGGVRVASIAADHVVLRAPDGSEQILKLRREGVEE